MEQRIVAAQRCPLMAQPSSRSEQVDELLTGWRCRALDRPRAGWVSVCSDYGYRGFAPEDCLAPAEGPPGERQVVTAAVCPVLERPQVRSPALLELVRGALVQAEGVQGDWTCVRLPDGRRGYMCPAALGRRGRNLSQEEFRVQVTGWAMGYVGAPYRWGGKSPLGIDCSGLAFMAYWLSGAVIFRDAVLSEPVRPIPRRKLDRGDLLYFPGHVALYLGGGVYIHASARPDCGGVVCSSLDPAHPNYRGDLAQSLLAVGSLFP
ncbi:MAG: C40 family peptidase [Oscillospiraceae bacterium]|nr:C40 family peptidase [Oscillospiraceae bacterium]